MGNWIMQFIAIALVSGIGLSILPKLGLDRAVVKFIRVAVLVPLTLLLINLAVVMVTGHGIPALLGAARR